MLSPARTAQAGNAALIISGIGFAIAAYFVSSLQDATIKWLVAGLPAPQILFVRSLVIVPFCLVVGGPRVAIRAVMSPIRLQLLWRSLVLVAAWISYYSAARYLQLAELTTFYFSSPLIVAALAFPLLRERVTGARWASLVVGFAGVVIACRPGDVEHPGPIVLAILAAALWAYTTILIRQIVQAEPTLVLLFASNLTILLACGLAMPVFWHEVSARQFLLMLAVGLLGAASQFMNTEAIRRAPATVVGPISFTSLLWAFILGVVIWGDIPDRAVFIGAGLILASGLIVVGSEWRAGRRRVALPAS